MPTFKRASDKSAAGSTFNAEADARVARYHQVLAREPKPPDMIAREALIECHKGIIAAAKPLRHAGRSQRRRPQRTGSGSAIMTVESPNMIPPGDLELTDENIQRMSPEVATATLAAMKKRHDAENPPHKSADGWLKMTPAEATAKLDELEMARRPLGADGKPIPAAPINPIISSHELQARQIGEALNDLEVNGFPARGTPVGDDLHAMLDGRSPVTPEVERAVRAKHAQCLADRAWGQRLLQGEQTATREWHTMTAILAAVEVQRPTRFGDF
jgi:hypothetical protein